MVDKKITFIVVLLSLLILALPSLSQAGEAKSMLEPFSREPEAITSYKLDSGRYSYSYDVKYISDARIDSEIKIKLSSTGKTFYLSSSVNLSPPEACNKDIGVIHEFVVGKEKLVVMCSGDTGHSRQLFVFKDADMIGRIEMGRSDPKVIDVVDNKALRVIRDSEFSLPNGGFDRLPRIVSMNYFGKNTYGFETSSDKTSKSYYQSEYQKQLISLEKKPQVDKRRFVRSSLAALVSFGDMKTVCNELINSPIFKGYSEQELVEFADDISNRGYKEFDITSCNTK